MVQNHGSAIDVLWAFMIPQLSVRLYSRWIYYCPFKIRDFSLCWYARSIVFCSFSACLRSSYRTTTRMTLQWTWYCLTTPSSTWPGYTACWGWTAVMPFWWGWVGPASNPCADLLRTRLAAKCSRLCWVADTTRTHSATTWRFSTTNSEWKTRESFSCSRISTWLRKVVIYLIMTVRLYVGGYWEPIVCVL